MRYGEPAGGNRLPLWAGVLLVAALLSGTAVGGCAPLEPKVVAIAAGHDFCCALKSDGTVRAWGRNEYGQLGNGSSISSGIPVSVSRLTHITAIAWRFMLSSI